MLWVYLIAASALLLLPLVFIFLSSKLSNFEHSSFLFRLQYALYTASPLGQWIHNYFLRSYHENHPQQPHHTVLSTQQFHNFQTFSVFYIPFLEDNYAYLLIDHQTGFTAAVDPADADLVHNTFNLIKRSSPASRELQLTTILCTHKHMDHAGGNSKLKQYYPQMQIISGNIEQVSSQTHSLSHQDTIQLGSTTIQLLETPCHTVGHVVYFVSSDDTGISGISNSTPTTALFSGDTLFIGGCGRFFEGNGTVMLSTLQLLRSLPPSTSIFCGHEYTVNNLAFCLLIDPDNEILQKKYEWALQRRQSLLPTIPSLLSEEMRYNVFLRYDQRVVVEVIEKRIHQRKEKEESEDKKMEVIDEKKVMILKSSHVLVLEELRRWRNLED